MAIDAFLYFPRKEILGETTDEKYKIHSAFALKSYSFGAESTKTVGSSTPGGGGGKTSFEPFKLDKVADTASCGIFSALCSGQHIDEAILVLRKSGGGGNSSGGEFMTYRFKMVIFKNYTVNGNEDETEESVEFDYGAIKIEYSEQKIDGNLTKASGTKGEAKWSQVKNKAVYSVV